MRDLASDLLVGGVDAAGETVMADGADLVRLDVADADGPSLARQLDLLSHV
jgi:hypothetical protein